MWIELLSATGAATASYAFASTVLSFRGLHDWLVPGAVYRCGPGAIALTFDDGPHPERTPRVLDLLAQAKVHATFFLIGERAVAHPELVRRIAAEGHEVGNHSWSHARRLPFCSGRRIEAELSRCQDALAELTGVTPRLFRPPYGARDVRVYRIARALELTPVLWSVDSFDWAGVSAQRVLARARRARGGDVVLLHDGDPKAEGLLPALAEWLPALPAPAGPAHA